VQVVRQAPKKKKTPVVDLSSIAMMEDEDD
jgi:hypothetical protein